MDTDRREASAPTGFAIGRTALLVDDDLTYRQVLSEVLTEDGWDVIEASTGEDALKVSSPDMAPILLVTDINLGPGMDGWALGRLVRNQWPGIGLLFISGENQPGRRDDDLLSEVFLAKPISLPDFLAAVTGVVHTVAAGVAPMPRMDHDNMDMTIPTSKQPTDAP